MKKILIIAIISLFGIFSNYATAQKLKFGYIDSQKLLAMMPERESAQKALETQATELQNQLEEMQVEYNNKLQEYLGKRDSLAPLVRETKEEELKAMQERIESFKGKAQTDLQKKQTELLQPIMDKAKKAIEEVGKENGFNSVFDMGSGAIIYTSDDWEDILPLVKKKLAITEEKQKTNTAPTDEKKKTNPPPTNDTPKKDVKKKN